MARPKRIVVHCTGDPADALRNKEYFRHLFFDVYKWGRYGYHFIVYQDGFCEALQPSPSPNVAGGNLTPETIAFGAKGFNLDSIHVAYVGGFLPVPGRWADTRTPAQKETLRELVARLKRTWGITEVVGHRDLPYVKKACPCFDARKEFSNV